MYHILTTVKSTLICLISVCSDVQYFMSQTAALQMKGSVDQLNQLRQVIFKSVTD